jgi:hypothetical protein
MEVSFRIISPALALKFKNGTRQLITVPVNSIITIQSDSVGERLVNVIWQEMPFQMFMQDIRERGEQLSI